MREFGVEDEYDRYIPQIVGLLMREDQAVTAELIAASLLKIATDRMGLSLKSQLLWKCDLAGARLARLRRF